MEMDIYGKVCQVVSFKNQKQFEYVSLDFGKKTRKRQKRFWSSINLWCFFVCFRLRVTGKEKEAEFSFFTIICQ